MCALSIKTVRIYILSFIVIVSSELTNLQPLHFTIIKLQFRAFSDFNLP